MLISSCNTDCTHIVHVLFKKWNTKTGYWVNIWQHVRYTKLITKCISSSSSSFFVRYFDLMIITCYFYFLFILIFWVKYCYYLFMNGFNFCFWLMFCLQLSWFKVVVTEGIHFKQTLKILQSEKKMIDKIRLKFARRYKMIKITCVLKIYSIVFTHICRILNHIILWTW